MRVMADRGMSSAQTSENIKAPAWRYILGARMRRTREANAIVLARAGPYEEVYPESADAKAPSRLKMQEVWIVERRNVVCLNPADGLENAPVQAAQPDSFQQDEDERILADLATRDGAQVAN